VAPKRSTRENEDFGVMLGEQGFEPDDFEAAEEVNDPRTGNAGREAIRAFPVNHLAQKLGSFRQLA
jgi:hypothetical protein